MEESIEQKDFTQRFSQENLINLNESARRENLMMSFKDAERRHHSYCKKQKTSFVFQKTDIIRIGLLCSNFLNRDGVETIGLDDAASKLGVERRWIYDIVNVLESVGDFYEDLFEELSKYGEIESLNICDNLADHMVGNVYVQFRDEEDAASAVQNLTGRFYAGRPIIVDFSPVTDFREATCRQYEENTCNRGGYCNFMHLKKISRELRRQLFGRYKRRHRSRSRSPHRSRDSEERSHGGRGHGRSDDREHRHHDSRSRRSPGRRRDRSRSPGGKRKSPSREGSAERRAKIEQWNREKEQAESGNKDSNTDTNNGVYAPNEEQSYDLHEKQQRPQEEGYDY